MGTFAFQRMMQLCECVKRCKNYRKHAMQKMRLKYSFQCFDTSTRQGSQSFKRNLLNASPTKKDSRARLRRRLDSCMSTTVIWKSFAQTGDHSMRKANASIKPCLALLIA